MTARGFTLIELLVALFITAIMFVIGYGELDQALRSRRELDEHSARLIAVQQALRTIEQDFELLQPRPVRNLVGDGYLPGLKYHEAGVRLAIGTDEQIRIDPFEELRELETLARREGHTRYALLAAAGGDLWGQMVAHGRASLGLQDPPAPIELDLDHPDLAGVADQDLPLALATCASAAVVSAGVGQRR